MGKTVETLSEGQFSQVKPAPSQEHMIISCVVEYAYSIEEHRYGHAYASQPFVKTQTSVLECAETTTNTHT